MTNSQSDIAKKAAGAHQSPASRLRQAAGIRIPSFLLAILLCTSCGDDSGAIPHPPTNPPTVDPLPAPIPGAPTYLVAPVSGRASKSEPDSSPGNAYDFDALDSIWNSGEYAPQWLELDLGSPRVVSRIDLTVAQLPEGLTRHRILAGNHASAMQPIADLAGHTSNGQVLSIEFSPAGQRAVRFIRIETSESPSWVAWNKVAVYALATNMPSYFGYYGDGFSWLSSATEEVSDHVNVSWVGTGLQDISDMPRRIQHASDLGLKAAVAIPQELFFLPDFSMNPTFASDWQSFAAAIRPHIHDVSLLLPIDEPYSQSKIAGIAPATMQGHLTRIGEMIKLSFPTVPLAFTFSAIDFDTQDSAFTDLENPIPQQFDLIGFDCYGSWEHCGEPAYRSVHSIPWYFDRLEEKLYAHQQIFLFPDGFVRESSPADPDQEASEAEKRLTRADQYLQLAYSEQRLVGLFGFLYQDDYIEEGSRFLGVRHWPDLLAKYRSMGMTITGR